MAWTMLLPGATPSTTPAESTVATSGLSDFQVTCPRVGETLSSLLRREPVFLFPQLEKRGFRWLGGFQPDGVSYELTVRAPS